jgi:hypothetical protein
MFHFSLLTLTLITLPALIVSQQTCNNKFGSSRIPGECRPVKDCRGAHLESNNSSCGNVNKCCMEDITVNVAPNNRLTKNIFLKLIGNTSRNDAMYNYFVQSLPLAGVSTGSNADYKMCAYLAQIWGETNGLENMESRLIDEDDDRDLGNNEKGDGETWQGRGGIMVRGKTNYDLANKADSRYSTYLRLSIKCSDLI